MIRTQISLTEAQHETLREVAAQRGVSMSALIREAVEATVLSDREGRTRELIKALQESDFRSGFADVSENHDYYLYGKGAELR